MPEETRDTRRNALKKVGRAAAIAIPTIVTFNVSNLAVAASCPEGTFQRFDTITPEKEDIRSL